MHVLGTFPECKYLVSRFLFTRSSIPFYSSSSLVLSLFSIYIIHALDGASEKQGQSMLLSDNIQKLIEQFFRAISSTILHFCHKIHLGLGKDELLQHCGKYVEKIPHASSR